MDLDETDKTVQKVYQAEEQQIQIHRSQVTPFPPEMPAGFFWYGRKHNSFSSRLPQWIEDLLLVRESREEDQPPTADGKLGSDVETAVNESALDADGHKDSKKDESATHRSLLVVVVKGKLCLRD